MLPSDSQTPISSSPDAPSGEPNLRQSVRNKTFWRVFSGMWRVSGTLVHSLRNGSAVWIFDARRMNWSDEPMKARDALLKRLTAKWLTMAVRPVPLYDAGTGG